MRRTRSKLLHVKLIPRGRSNSSEGSGHDSASITLNMYSHLWPNADDRTRTAAAGLFDQAVRNGAYDEYDAVKSTAGLRL
jgi:hypothetical protein